MLPDERIRWQSDDAKAPEFVELYLLETMSFGEIVALLCSSRKELIGSLDQSLSDRLRLRLQG
jgi:hypothetical protein